MILSYLADQGSEFLDVSNNPFMLQFFLLFSTQPELDQKGIQGHTLRYFPLKTERARLQSTEVNSEILSNLAARSLHLAPAQTPSEFSRNYPWRASSSLVGYAYETGAARYFADWQQEPITRGEEDVDRDIATTIMQTVRGSTPHQFTIPLFADRGRVGAIIINTRSAISEAGRLLSIRCARGCGLPLEMALKMDDEVNNITAQLTEVRTYKHVLSSLLHEEGTYLTVLGNFYDSIYFPDPKNPVESWEPKVRHILADRDQLVSEFETSPRDPGTGAVDPIRHIQAKTIFHRLGATHDTTIEKLEDSLNLLKELFPQAKILRTEFRRGSGNRALTAVPGVKTMVLLRILGNLMRNTARVASGRRIESPYLEFSFDTTMRQGRSYLEIVATDNCGGFKDDVPVGEISFEIWSNYLKELEKHDSKIHGMGYLTLLKYALSTKGLFKIGNTMDEQGMRGARIVLQIGLE